MKAAASLTKCIRSLTLVATSVSEWNQWGGKSSCSRRSTRNAGFTLIELLVAAGITALLAGFIAVIVNNVSVVWTRSGNRLGTDSQARIVLDQLQLDLQAASYRDDGNVWFAADVLNNTSNSSLWQAAARNPKPPTNLSLQMTAPNIANARFGVAGVWLRFFTTSRGSNTAATPATISAPVAVGYQLIRRFTATNPANLDSTAYMLHRTEVRPAATGSGASLRPGVLESGFDITAAAYSGSSGSSNNNGSNPADPRAIKTPGSARVFDAVLAENVIDFGVRCYVNDASVPGGLRLIFPAVNENGTPSNAPNTQLRGRLPSNTPPSEENYNQLFPDVIDVVVRILTAQGATLIANLEKVQTPALPVPIKYNGNAQEWWWGVAQENSRVYTRRIVVNAKPL